MRRLIAPEDMLSCEKKYFAESGVPSISIMENAAKALADAALSRFPAAETIYIACGPGGNGGDGYACARLLHEAGKKCEIFASAPAKSPDAAENCRRAMELGIPVHLEKLPDAIPGDEDAMSAGVMPDLWIDCLYGTGLSREPSGRSAQLIWRMMSAPVIACDIPSGLNGNTGKAYVPCVRADVTVTFQLAKFGHFLQDGLDMCRKVIVADVGFPKEVFSGVRPPNESVVLFGMDFHLLRRMRNTHKGSYGHLLIIAGSFGMAGAAALCAKAALRSGVGLVTICCPEEIIPILQIHAPQAMCTPLSADNLKKVLPGKTAVAIGPGLTRNIDPEILKIVLESGLPAVIDADALNILSENPELKALLKPRHVLTPHPGEAARLLGRKCCDPIADAKELAAMGATVVLKGASRVIASDKINYISASGGCGMARGGSGDILTGILGALLAQRFTNAHDFCAAVACEIHGQAGELAQEKYGSYAMNSADIIEFLPEVFRKYAD